MWAPETQQQQKINMLKNHSTPAMVFECHSTIDLYDDVMNSHHYFCYQLPQFLSSVPKLGRLSQLYSSEQNLGLNLAAFPDSAQLFVATAFNHC